MFYKHSEGLPVFGLQYFRRQSSPRIAHNGDQLSLQGALWAWAPPVWRVRRVRRHCYRVGGGCEGGIETVHPESTAHKSAFSGQPPRMIQAARADPAVDLLGMAAFSIRHPQVRHASGLRPTEGDLTSFRGLGAAKIPDPLRARRQERDRTGLGIDSSNGGAATGLVGLEVAVEMIGVWSLCLILPGDSGSGEAQGSQNAAVLRPDGHIGAAATVGC